MKVLKDTSYLHTYNAYGKPVKCNGHLQIVEEDGVVHVRCRNCGEGWKFHISINRTKVNK